MKPTHIPGLVSVVVASYNHAAYLTRRMESLIRQTYPEIEIIVIDDRSPDNSVEILRHYVAHPKVRLVVRETNGGWVAVSNQGVGLARGEFVLFANCDDECEPRMIERLVDAMRNHPTAGIAYCRSLLVDEVGQILGDDFTSREASFRRRCAEDVLISGEEAGKFLLHSCVIPNLSAVLFRREYLEVAGGLSNRFRVCSDWELFFRLVRTHDVAYVAESLNRFRQHSRTIRSSTRGRIIYHEYIQLLSEQVHLQNLSWTERLRFRARLMYLWSDHIIGSGGGLRDFPYHLKLVWESDRIALLCLIPATVLRMAVVTVKFITGIKSEN